MKALLLLLFCSPCWAYYPGEDWSVPDTALQAAVTAALYVDMRQSLEIAESKRWVETNPFLGAHPSNHAVRFHFERGAVEWAVISMLLPPTWRTIWQAGTIGFEVSYIQHNWHMGIRGDL